MLAALGLVAAPGHAEPQARALTLAQSVERALRLSPKLQIRRTQEAEARVAIGEQRGGLFPTLASGVRFRRETNAMPYAYGETGDLYDESSLTYEAGLKGLFPLAAGLRYDLSFSSTVTWTDLNAAILSPRHINLLQLTLTQPLLKGFGRHALASKIEASRIDHEAALEEVEQEIAALLDQVVRAYWQLVARQAELEIAVRAHRLAQQQLALAEERVRVGTLSKVDLYEARAKVASRRQAQAAAEIAQTKAETELLQLTEAATREVAQRGVRATDAFADVGAKRDLAALVAAAMRQRPEIRALRHKLRAAGIRTRTADNAALPRLDVQAAAGLASLAGEATCSAQEDPLCFEPNPTLVGGHGLAWKQIVTGKMPFWQVGLVFELPLGGEARRAAADKSRLAERRLQLELEQAQQRAAMEVRDALHRLQGQARQLEAARTSVEHARTYLEAAEAKFKGGLGTSTDVLRAQDTLIAAEHDLVKAQLELMVTRAELEAATGNLPGFLGVKVR